jgi:murein DD-endopeptidase MepM/ murein hydrolase activator NlpD
MRKPAIHDIQGRYNTANWSGVMNSDQFIRLTKPDTKSTIKLTKNSIIEVLGEVNTYYYISAVVNSKTQWGFVPKTEVRARFVWPLAAYHNPTGWGWRYNEGKVAFHNGIDVGTSGQTPNVLAFMDGKIVNVKNSVGNNLGRYVIIEHTVNGVKYYSRYQHLSSIAINDGIVVGKEVVAGKVIGKVGGSGTSQYRYDPHLHFELSKSAATNSATSINPISIYFANDTRNGTNINDQPLFKNVNGVYQYNPSFNWNWSDSSLPAKYSHSTSYRK